MGINVVNTIIGVAPLITLLALLPLTARAGEVRTTDGSLLQGLVSIGDDGSLAVDSGEGSTAHVAPEDVLQAVFANGSAPPMKEGILLVDGSRISGHVVTADRSLVHYERGADVLALGTQRVAQFQFSPDAADLLRNVVPGRAGAVLANGDFEDGSMVALDAGRVELTSLIFGPGELQVQRQVLGIVSAPVAAENSRWVVELMDGSRLLASDVTIDQGSLVVSQVDVGALRLASTEIYALRIGAARLRTLVPLMRQTSTTFFAGSVDQAAAAGRIPMRLQGIALREGVEIGAGTSVRIPINGQGTALTATVGVPMSLVPSAAVRFVAKADGKVVFTSLPLTSLDPAEVVCVPLKGVRLLELSVESSTPPALGAWGVWGDPAAVAE